MKYFLEFILINIVKNIGISPDEGDIRDIKNLIGSGPIFVYLLIFILVVMAALVLVFFLRRRKKINILKEETQASPPDVAALDKIRKLKELKLIEQGKIKEFCTILSDIIRVFLEDTYKISALDRTTYELISELKNKKIMYGKVEMVQKFLYDCDLVKFAKYIPTRENLDKLLSQAEEIINIVKIEQAGSQAEIKINV